MIHLLQRALSFMFFLATEPAKIMPHPQIYSLCTHMGHHYNIIMSTKEGISPVYRNPYCHFITLLESWNQTFEHALSHVVKF